MTVDAMSVLRDEVEQRISWYKRSRNWNRSMYYGFLILSLACSFAASTIAAVGNANESVTKSALVTLPLLAAFCAYLLRQFNWRDVYQLREQGRIDALELLFLVRQLRSESAEDVARLEAAVYAKLIDLSRKQAGGFFSFTKDRDDHEMP